MGASVANIQQNLELELSCIWFQRLNSYKEQM